MSDTAICLITNNRPEYFSKCIDYLVQCNGIEKYDIMTGEEPPSTNLDECFNKLSQYCNVYRNINSEIKHITKNIKDVLDLAFINHESAIIIEEDILLSKDALGFCNEILTKFNNDTKCLSVSLYYNNIETVENSLFNKYEKFHWFEPLGWATWKNRWTPFSETIYYNWFDNEIENNCKDNWDSRLQKYKEKNKMYVIHPFVSRSSHIGYNGLHCGDMKNGKEWIDKYTKAPYGGVYFPFECNEWVEIVNEK